MPHYLSSCHAEARIRAQALVNVELAEGRAEAIPAPADSLDAVLASLSLMYVTDRAAAASEIARPGGRFVAAVWASAEDADIVLFQQTAGGFAPTPPVPGVGPGALADPQPFLAQLAAVGLTANYQTDITSFQFGLQKLGLLWPV